MNYLQLVQRLWLEAGVSGTSPGLSTVAGQTGELGRLVTWTNEAWKDIQSAHDDWGWMRASASFATVSSTSSYPLGTGAGTVGVATASFGKWIPTTGRCYVTSAGVSSEAFLDVIPLYDDWKNAYFFGAARYTTSRPTVLAIAPDKSICLGPVPGAGYTVTLDYFSAPTDLTADADIPALPTKFHMAIVYRALMFYGAYEVAPEAYQRGELEFKKLMERMTADRLPPVTWGPALA
jgi:hypothetical protein